MSHQESKAHFFRQGAWLVIATVGGGIFMTAVHTVVGKLDKSEYSIFLVLLRTLTLFGIPSAGLQVVFARQAAAVVDEQKRRELTGTVRGVLLGIFAIWLIMTLLIVIFHDSILTTMKIDRPMALWVSLIIFLTNLWTPITRGLLQGEQNFMGLGWTMVLDGAVRFASICVIILLLHGNATGAIIGAIIGQIISLGLGVYWTRHIVFGPMAAVNWRPWLAQAVPFTLGAGAVVFLSSVDCIFVKSIVSEDDSALYLASYMIGFAMLQFTVPLAQVMFPKVARSAAMAQKSDALKLTLLSTAALGVAAVIGCALLPKLPLQVLYFTKPALWAAAPIVPWYVGCILLLTLANVLINDQLAHGRFGITPWLVALCVLYLCTLLGLRTHFAGLELFTKFRQVIYVSMSFNLASLALAAWFVWGKKRPVPTA